MNEDSNLPTKVCLRKFSSFPFKRCYLEFFSQKRYESSLFKGDRPKTASQMNNGSIMQIKYLVLAIEFMFLVIVSLKTK